MYVLAEGGDWGAMTCKGGSKETNVGMSLPKKRPKIDIFLYRKKAKELLCVKVCLLHITCFV